MTQNFLIKKGKENSFYFVVICLFLTVVWASRTSFNLGLTPLIFLLSISVLLEMIMFFRWIISFAVFLDVEKQEIILNHSLFFYKKKISLKDIKEIDTLNGNIILFPSVSLSKCQKMVCKTKKAGGYTIRFDKIHICERRQLMELLLTLNR